MGKNKLIIFTLITVSLLVNMPLMAGRQSARKNILQESFLKKQFCLRGGLGMFSVNGAEGDYAAGANDFPVTPAYQSPAFGFGFAVFTSRSFAVGLDFRYGLSASVDLRDPSDGETISADTPKNLTAAIQSLQIL